MLLFYVSTFKAPFPLPEFWPDEIWVSNAASDDGAQHQYCFLQRVSNWNSWESILSIWNENLDLLWVIHARMNFWSGTWLHMGANCKKQLYIYRFIVSVIYTHTFFRGTRSVVGVRVYYVVVKFFFSAKWTKIYQKRKIVSESSFLHVEIKIGICT